MGRTTTIDFACLAFIAENAASGYDIHKASKVGNLRFVLATSQAAIYEALRRLEGLGAIATTKLAQSGRPDRLVCRITRLGADLLPKLAREVVGKTVDREQAWLLLRFAPAVPVSELHAVIKARRVQVAAEVAALEDQVDADPAVGDCLAASVRAVLDAELDSLTSILDQTVARRSSTGYSSAGVEPADRNQSPSIRARSP